MTPAHQDPLDARNALRLRGVVENIGSPAAAPESGGEVANPSVSVQIRDLKLAATGEPCEVSAGRFRCGADWDKVGVQQGDTVLFLTSSRFVIQEPEHSAGPRRLTRMLDEQANQMLVIRRPTPGTNLAAVGSSVPDRSEKTGTAEEREAPPTRLMQTKLRPLLVAAIGAVLAALVGGVIGWTLAQRQQSPANPSMPQRLTP